MIATSEAQTAVNTRTGRRLALMTLTESGAVRIVRRELQSTGSEQKWMTVRASNESFQVGIGPFSIVSYAPAIFLGGGA